MFRNRVRRDIRAVQAGSEPVGLFRNPGLLQQHGRACPTGKSPELFKKLPRKTGRRLAQSYFEASPLMACSPLRSSE